MAVLWIIRVIGLIFVILLSCAVAGLGGNYLAKYLSFGENPNIPGILDGETLLWVCLSIADAGLSVLLVTPIYNIRRLACRRRNVSSGFRPELAGSLYFAKELQRSRRADQSVSKLLTSYLALNTHDYIAGLEALAISDPQQYGELLDVDLDSFGMLCRSHQAIEALGFLSRIILMGYAITLLISALIAKRCGHPAIWLSTVRDTHFLARHDEQPYYREEIDVPMAALQQNYYASDPNLKMETTTLVSDSTMHAQKVHQ